MSQDWYTYGATADAAVAPMMQMLAGFGGYGYGSGGVMARTQRIQGAFQADSGTLQQLSVKGDLTLDSGGTVTAAPSYPAVGQKATFNASGFATFNSTPAQTSAFNADGSGFIGIGGSTMSWTAAGVVTIPVAAIGSLTIANVGGGVFGGKYGSAATGARIEMDTVGFRQYDATTLRAQLNNDGSGFVGSKDGTSAGAAISWSTAGVGSIKLATATGASITDDNGSTWNNTGIAIKTTATDGAAFSWTNSTAPGVTGYVANTSVGAMVGRTGYYSIHLHNTGFSIYLQGTGFSSLTPGIEASTTAGSVTIKSGSGAHSAIFDAGGNLQLAAAFFPGNQNTRYIDDNGTDLTINGGNLAFVSPYVMKVGVWGGGASGALPSPTKWFQILNAAGATWYVPAFSAVGPWAA